MKSDFLPHDSVPRAQPGLCDGKAPDQLKRAAASRTIGMALCALAGLGSSLAMAESETEARIKQLIEPKMGVNIKVDSVQKTPYGGLYEVRTNGDIFYTDETAQYLFIGRVVDTNNQYKDLTKARVDEISAISFADLPLDSALKLVKGNGKRVFAVFADPHCPYCKNLHKIFDEIDNATIYTFLLNIVTEESSARSRNIWCAPNRNLAWDQWMRNGKLPPAAPANCKAPNDEVLALGKKFRVVGTPTIYFADGSRTGSVGDAKTLEARLESVPAK
jgi:thiol:disulfide interchange protein DsbC